MDEMPPSAPAQPQEATAARGAGKQKLLLVVLAAAVLAAFVGYAQLHSAQPLLDVNTATREQLLTVPGLSPETADSLINLRPFDTAEDFAARVKGLPPEVTARIVPGLAGKPACCVP